MFNPQNKNKCLKDICNCTPVIIGPTGPQGISDTIKIRNTTTTEAGEDAQVIDNQIENNHTLDFIIPRGPTERLFKSSNKIIIDSS